MPFISRTFRNFSFRNILQQGYLFFQSFSKVFNLGANLKKKYCILHIVSNHYYPFIEIHLYQDYFNMSCH